MADTLRAAAASPRLLATAGFLLGFGLGGFFDGILLHQLLQWHHLLSGLQAEPWPDLRMQILADGLFHALMYLIAVAGLLVLWRARAALDAAGTGRRLLSSALAGFGAWHVVDAVVSHWLTGIHRIRMDEPNPLFWDLLWLVLFGLLPLAVAWYLVRSRPATGGDAAAAAAIAALAVGAGLLAARQPPASEDLVVVFRPGVSAAQALEALGRVDARVVWTDGLAGVWAVKADPALPVLPLYRDGALLVSRSAVALGCLSWSRAGGR